MNATSADPYQLLGISADASSDDVRQAYLKRVREFPPDRDPDRFREIHDAYTMLSDPLVQAKALLIPPEADQALDLNEVINLAEKRRPRLPKLVLLAMGNAE